MKNLNKIINLFIVLGAITIIIIYLGDKGKDISEIKKTVVEIISDHSTGSGVIISKDGLIVSNYHVVFDKEGKILANIKVKLFTRTFDFKVIDFDKKKDLVILKIDIAKKLAYAKLSRFKDLKVGQEVYAIGFPLGQGKFTTKGIISQFTFKKGILYIGTDAMINPGNSGGGLFLKSGRLVGINTYMLLRGHLRHSSNMGFALSSKYLETYINN